MGILIGCISKVSIGRVHWKGVLRGFIDRVC